MRDDFGTRPYSVRFPYGREGMKKVALLRKEKNRATKIEKMNLSVQDAVKNLVRNNLLKLEEMSLTANGENVKRNLVVRTK